MDMTITTDKVTTLLGTLPSTDPRPNAENIYALHLHIECALQLLPCPQSVHLGRKGLTMSQGMYTLLVTGGNTFRLSVYARANPADATPLSLPKQATVNATFALEEHYYQSLVNINHAVFLSLCASVNEAFQVSNIPGIVRWHADMEIRAILDQLSSTYGMPTPAALEHKDVTFRSAYSPADAPKVLFCHIKNCAEIVIIGNNPYTNRQIVNNTIRLLLMTGMYVRAFEVWDCLTPVNQTWIELRCTIQEAFQRQLNATAPMAGVRVMPLHSIRMHSQHSRKPVMTKSPSRTRSPHRWRP